ncbi:MAG: class I SAM-dependent methyltransferase [Acidobacteriota bacterium]
MMVDVGNHEVAATAAEPPDIETSSEGYASRFAGLTGEWMLRAQEKIVLQILSPTPGARVLDVGGGHGQLANPLCRQGFDVTVLASSESCKHRVAEIVDAGLCAFDVGNLLSLPYQEMCFDTVISFRLLTHCSNWPVLVKELCRVAKHSVIVDFPTSRSLNAFAPLLFGAKRRLEGNTRPWISFTGAEIVAEFSKNGYVLGVQRRQFFLPMAFHRLLRMRPVSVFLEAFCRKLGLTSAWGSPVIVEMVRSTDHD